MGLPAFESLGKPTVSVICQERLSVNNLSKTLFLYVDSVKMSVLQCVALILQFFLMNYSSNLLAEVIFFVVQKLVIYVLRRVSI